MLLPACARHRDSALRGLHSDDECGPVYIAESDAGDSAGTDVSAGVRLAGPRGGTRSPCTGGSRPLGYYYGLGGAGTLGEMGDRLGSVRLMYGVGERVG